ncbi:MAG: hypothetical protein LBI95_00970 [Holosporales bacterium]|jgi:hypothetical protein|nr:hypothetical protein [Holosporales bacterium]
MSFFVYIFDIPPLYARESSPIIGEIEIINNPLSSPVIRKTALKNFVKRINAEKSKKGKMRLIEHGQYHFKKMTENEVKELFKECHTSVDTNVEGAVIFSEIVNGINQDKASISLNIDKKNMHVEVRAKTKDILSDDILKQLGEVRCWHGKKIISNYPANKEITQRWIDELQTKIFFGKEITQMSKEVDVWLKLMSNMPFGSYDHDTLSRRIGGILSRINPLIQKLDSSNKLLSNFSKMCHCLSRPNLQSFCEDLYAKLSNLVAEERDGLKNLGQLNWKVSVEENRRNIGHAEIICCINFTRDGFIASSEDLNSPNKESGTFHLKYGN